MGITTLVCGVKVGNVSCEENVSREENCDDKCNILSSKGGLISLLAVYVAATMCKAV